MQLAGFAGLFGRSPCGQPTQEETHEKRIAIVLAMLTLLVLLPGCAEKTMLDPKDPVTLTMWHVYGEQADSPMNQLVEEFNQTVGREQGIIINVTLMSSTAQIGEKLLGAQAGTPGVPVMPDLFFAHNNNAEELGAENLLDRNSIFTEEELSSYVPEFLDDGMVGENLCVFPVSKSTQLLFVAGTQFERFAADTGVSYDDLATWDGFLTWRQSITTGRAASLSARLIISSARSS